jgi:hypothetical protein
MSLVARWLHSRLTPREGWRAAGAEWTGWDGDRQGCLCLGLCHGLMSDGCCLERAVLTAAWPLVRREERLVAAEWEGRREAILSFVLDGRA